MKNLLKLLSKLTIFGAILISLGVAIIIFALSRIHKTIAPTQNYSAQELFNHATAQIDAGQYQTAETYLEQALAKQDDPTYHNQLAVVEYRLKKYDQAISEYHKLIDRQQDVAFAWNGIGNAYRDWVGHNDQAITAYQSAIVASSKYVAAYSNYALLLHSLGRDSEAIKILDQGIAATGQPELIQIKKNIGG